MPMRAPNVSAVQAPKRDAYCMACAPDNKRAIESGIEMGCDTTGWNKAKSCAGRRMGGCYALPFSLPLAMALNCALPAVLFAQTAMHTMLPVWHGVRFRRCPVHDDKVDAGKRQIKLAFLEHAAGNGSLLPLLHGQGCFCLRKKARGWPSLPRVALRSRLYPAKR